MKGFIIGLAISTTVMFGVVYATIINPSLLTNIIGANETNDEFITVETEGNGLNEEFPVEETTNLSYQELIKKGNTLIESGYPGLAVFEFQAAIQLETKNDEGFYKLGEAYFYDENHVDAANNLQTAIDLNSENLEAKILLGKTYIELEQFENAKAHFDTINSTSATVLYYKGILDAYFGNYDQAQITLQKVIDSGESADLSQNANNYLNSMAEFALAQDAIESYKKTLVGRSLAETDQPTLAISLLYDVLREEPDYRDAWIIIGFVYLSTESYEDAQDALLKAVELDPTKGETRYFLGLAYFGEEEIESAIIQFELALESGFEPQVQVYQKLGDAAVLIGDYTKAAGAYENVLTLNSSEVDLYIRPVWLYLDHLNDIPKALELAERATLEHPNEAMGYNLLGWAQTINGDYVAAEQNLNYALILDPDLSAGYLNLGRWHELQGQYEEAKDNYKRSYTLDADGSVGNLAAQLYNKLVEKQTAEEAAT
ncbi:MAG: tetratricopeptide repeat protein [Candidatus Peregrinibacteria bacterium]|nr:tetratricopeptide repeat protein [Candidatus Peregrinibacteria bacterium]